jgi:hypothetical protein
MTTPFARLRAFLADYAAQWNEVAESGDAAQWAAARQEIVDRHFAEGAAERWPSTFPPKPVHALNERVLETTTEGDRARIRTTHGSQFFQYVFVERGGEWRLESINASAEDAGPLASPPLVAPSARAAILAGTSEDARFEPLPDGFVPNADRAFTPGTKLDATTDIVVEHVGMLRLRTGVIAVQDLSHGVSALAPFTRRLPPGEYPVELAISEHRPPPDTAQNPPVNIALRLRIGPARPTVAWHPATDTKGGQGAIGVDAGTLCMFDVGSFVQLTEHRWMNFVKGLWQDWDEDSNIEVNFLSLVEPDDCVVATSGFGDGEYPCYWGVDVDGKLAVLQIDFVAVR